MALIDSYALISLTDLKENLGITNEDSDALLTNIVNRASASVESYCDRHFIARDWYEWHDGNGTKELQLDEWPLVRVYRVAYGLSTALTVSGNVAGDLSATVSMEGQTLTLHRIAADGTPTTTEIDLDLAANRTTTLLANVISAVTGFGAVMSQSVPSRWLHRLSGIDVVSDTLSMTFVSDAEAEYRTDFERGMVRLRSTPHFYYDADYVESQHFPSTAQSILVHYKAGFGSVPYDVQQATIEIATMMFRDRDTNPSLSSESLGDYSYTRRQVSTLLESNRRYLEPFKRLR